MLRILIFLLLLYPLAAVMSLAAERERNLWSILVERWPNDANGPREQITLGPLSITEEEHIFAIRPLYAQFYDKGTGASHYHFLYPLISLRKYNGGWAWKVLNLIRGEEIDQKSENAIKRFEVWPFYFSHQTNDSETSYRALFPIAGKLKDRFRHDRIKWLLFPLYGRFEKNDTITTTMPWPFIKILKGPQSHGFEFWPFYGHNRHENNYDFRYMLWPFHYRVQSKLNMENPKYEWGILPFYTTERSTNSISKTWLWPFFGYTEEREEPRYRERRYFWPFFVQGRGEEKSVNRWMPFYSHNKRSKAYEKTWWLWPLLRHERWEERGLARHRDQFLFFLYWSEKQTSLDSTQSLHAEKTHLWPFFSSWDDGAGRRQLQIFSPLEVFFPHNKVIRTIYSPLFALYRYDSRPECKRHNLLFGFITWQKGDTESSFKIGPFLTLEKSEKRWKFKFLKGLLGGRRHSDKTRVALVRPPFFSKATLEK